MNKYSRAEYLRIYRDSSENEGPLNIYIYRKLATHLVKLSVSLGFTPNQLTYVSFLMSATSAVLFANNQYHLAIIGLIPFHLGKVLDCADGQLARLTKIRSKFGAFIDPFLDRVVDVVLLSALARHDYLVSRDPIVFVLMMALLFIWYLSSYLEPFSIVETKSHPLRATTSFLPHWIRASLRWDGGFSGLIYTLGIVFSQVPALIAIHILVGTLSLAFQLKQSLSNLRSQDA